MFTWWDQFLSMAFAHFTVRESLRDTGACLPSVNTEVRKRGPTSAVFQIGHARPPDTQTAALPSFRSAAAVKAVG